MLGTYKVIYFNFWKNDFFPKFIIWVFSLVNKIESLLQSDGIKLIIISYNYGKTIMPLRFFPHIEKEDIVVSI